MSSSASDPSPSPPSSSSTSSSSWPRQLTVLQEWLWTALSQVLDVLLWIFWGDASATQAGQSPDHPLEIYAVPGLASLLDRALFCAVEAELTGTIHTSHCLLQAWLDVQRQARRVLRFGKQHVVVSISGSSNQSTSDAQQRRVQLESFARACLEGSCNVIERMSTDRLAYTANLTDPFDTTSTLAPSSLEHRATSAGSNDGTHHSHMERSSHHHLQQQQQQQQELLLQALQESAWDMGRRLPVPQQPRDCWESSRMHCLDYCWGDEVVGLCHKTLRHLMKQPFVPATFSEYHQNQISSSPLTMMMEASGGGGSSGGGGGTEASAPQASRGGFFGSASGSGESFWTSTLEQQEAKLLLQLLLVDVPTRLTQFKSALEAESVVSKRLYLVKSEYRAPLRAFFEAHTSVQRAPSLELVEQSLKKLSASSSSPSPSSSKRSSNKSHSKESSSSSNTVEDDAKERLQTLLERPELVELLALERQMEQYELDMALALFPFCELARFLDHKKAAPKTNDTALRNVLARLKNLLVTSAGSSALLQQQQRRNSFSSSAAASSSSSLVSAGIRPLLLDLQGVPRDEEEDTRPWVVGGARNKTSHSAAEDQIQRLQSPQTMALMDRRVNDFVSHIKHLSKLCSEKQKSHAFSSERSNKTTQDVEPPMATLCQKFDQELFKCHFKDWYTMAVRQHELTLRKLVVKTNEDDDEEEETVEESGMDRLAEEIRRAEMAVSLSLVSTEPALRKVQERVEMITRDRIKRFDILKSSLEDLCLREMNWHVNLVAPKVDQVLELKPTDGSGIVALSGVFGVPLLRAKQVLPLG